MKVPWLPKSGIQQIADDVIAGYESKMERKVTPPIPVEDIIERYLNLKIGFMDFEKKTASTAFSAPLMSIRN